MKQYFWLLYRNEYQQLCFLTHKYTKYPKLDSNGRSHNILILPADTAHIFIPPADRTNILILTADTAYILIPPADRANILILTADTCHILIITADTCHILIL